METVSIRKARASFSALVAGAEKGRPTLVTRHGQPCAMIIPVAASARLYPSETRNLANYLVAFPAPLATDRDRTPMRPWATANNRL